MSGENTRGIGILRTTNHYLPNNLLLFSFFRDDSHLPGTNCTQTLRRVEVQYTRENPFRRWQPPGGTGLVRAYGGCPPK
eukprot:scaffold39225_cov47-Attheya_sp.AAC.1